MNTKWNRLTLSLTQLIGPAAVHDEEGGGSTMLKGRSDCARPANREDKDRALIGCAGWRKKGESTLLNNNLLSLCRSSCKYSRALMSWRGATDCEGNTNAAAVLQLFWYLQWPICCNGSGQCVYHVKPKSALSLTRLIYDTLSKAVPHCTSVYSTSFYLCSGFGGGGGWWTLSSIMFQTNWAAAAAANRALNGKRDICYYCVCSSRYTVWNGEETAAQRPNDKFIIHERGWVENPAVRASW